MRIMTSHHHPHKRDEEKHWINNFFRPGFHKDWRAWLVLGLMLAAITIYVLTLDESVQPVNAPQVPAATQTR
jgi:hypothetical protein